MNQKSFVQKNRILCSIFTLTIAGSMDALIPPTFPCIVRELEIPPQLIGLLLSLYAMPGIFLTLPAGVLVDKIGRRKPAILAFLLFSISGISIAFTPDFTLMLILRFIQGIGRTFLLFLGLILIGDFFKGSERLQVMGINMTAFYVGSVAFSIVGGILSEFSWKYPFLFHASLLFATPFILGLKEPQITKRESALSIRAIFREIRKTEVLISLTSGLVVAYVYTGAILASVPLFLNQKFGSTSSFIGISLATLQMVSAFTAFFTRKLTRYLSNLSLLITSLAFYGVLLSLISCIPNSPLFLPLSALLGLFHGILVTISPDLITGSPPHHMRGSVVSFYSTMVRIGQMSGSATIPFFLYLFNEGAFVFTGFICLFSTLPLIVLLRIRQS